MDARLVFVRTAKGEEEFARRVHGLAAPLRRVLILVDGKATVEQLKGRALGVPDVEQALAALAAEGFIATAEEAGRRGLGIGDPKAEILALARTLLGPQAAKVTKKIEEAGDTPERLAEAVEGSRKLIKLFIDESKAEEFVRRAQEILFAHQTTQMGR